MIIGFNEKQVIGSIVDPGTKLQMDGKSIYLKNILIVREIIKEEYKKKYPKNEIFFAYSSLRGNCYFYEVSTD
jgi:hypothetical protein